MPILDEGTVFRGTFNAPLYQLSLKHDDPSCAQIGALLWEWAERATKGDKDAVHVLETFHSLCHPEAAYAFFRRDALVERMPSLLAAAKDTDLADTSTWFFLLKCLSTAVSLSLQDASAPPMTLTVDALNNLKTPKLGAFDRIIAPVVSEMQKRGVGGKATSPPPALPAIPKSTVTPPSTCATLAALLAPEDDAIDETSFDKRWDNVRKKVAAIADTLVDVNSRAQALIVPPKVTWEKLRGRMIEDDVDRDNLIKQWKTYPTWQTDRAALAVVVEPMLIDGIKSHVAKWRDAKKGKSVLPDHPDPTKWGLMDKKERQIWSNNARYEQTSNHSAEVNELSRMFLAVVGHEHCLAMLEALPEPDNAPLRVAIANRLLERWEKAGTPMYQEFPQATPEMLSVVRAVYAQRVAHDAEADDRLEPSYRIHRYASILYRIGSDEAVAEARALLEAGEMNLCYSCVFGETAIARKDFAIIVPLAAHTFAGSAEKPLHRLMDALAQEDPDRHQAITVALIAQLARVTDKNQPAIHFELLDAIPQDVPAFIENVDTVAEALESTLPDVIKWAMTRLSALTAYDADWPGICRRAGEKLWSDQPGMVKEAAKFLGTVGAVGSDCREPAVEALSEALSLENVALQEAILKGLAAIKAKDKTLAILRKYRVEELAAAQPDRFGKIAAKLLA